MATAYRQPLKKIFISYRVHDSEADTGRLVDALKQVFYEEQIFMDIEKLEPGVDFTQAIARSLESCDVLLAVIGPEWAGAANQNGITRINLPTDWVRIELEAALNRNIRLIPVLERDASLPEQHELPGSLHPLLNRQAHEISRTRWKYDTDLLISTLLKIGIQPKPRPVPFQQSSSKNGAGKWIALSIVCVVLLMLVVFLLNKPADKNNSTASKNTAAGMTDTISAGSTTVPDEKKKPMQPAGTQPEETVAKPQEEVVKTNKNIEGSWYDAASMYNTFITQNGSILEFKTVALAGGQTGEGTGTIEGDKVKFRIQLYNVGIIPGTATISPDGQVMNGNQIEMLP
jgi:hypothetical protein